MATVLSLAKQYEETIHNYMAAIDNSLHPTRALDEEMVRKAVFLVRHDGVQIHSFNEERLLLEASVKDAHSVKVVLNFAKLTAVCACPQEVMCRHRLAVIFSLYQKVGSLSEWVGKWRDKENEELSPLTKKRSPEQWEALIRSTWREPINDYVTRNYFYFEQLYEGRLKNALSFMPIEREWKTLYKTYAHLISLIEVWDTFSAGTKEVHHSFFKTWFADELHALRDMLGQLRGLHRTFESDAFFTYLREVVRKFAETNDSSFSERFEIYQLFWTELFVSRRERMEGLEDFRRPDERVKAFFALLLGLDVTPGTIRADAAADWVKLAVLAEEEGHEQGLSAILMAIKPHVRTFLFDGLYTQYRHHYVRILSRLYSLIDLTEEDWEDLFTQFGHYGLPAYSAYLVEKGMYKQWAELHQLHNSPLYFAEECGLKEVHNAAPDFALPLYHRYALQYLDERSRTSYKQAVRVWKKMKSACKKSGQVAFWNAYMAEIQSRYKRLRALQEEIEKGKLI